MTLSRGSREGCLGLRQGLASGTYTKTAYSVWFLGTQLPSASPEGCLVYFISISFSILSTHPDPVPFNPVYSSLSFHKNWGS